MASIQVRTFTLGPYETNCYLVWPKGGTGCWIIDASFDPEPIIDAVREQGLTPELLILTHAHVDHIAGIAEIRRAFPKLPIVIHEGEAAWLGDAELNLSAYTPTPVTAPGPDRTLKEGDTLELGPTSWHVLHTPGHSPGSLSLHCAAAGIVFCGDALFAGSIGRTDFPGCSFEQLEKSIKAKLYTLPDNTAAFAGHGPATTIGREKKSNPFVRP